MLNELLSRVNGGELIGMIAISGGLFVALVAIIASNWRKARQASVLADLKRDLISQGRPTEEIERICNAGIRKGD